MPTIWSNLLNLFFPNACKICGRPLIEGEEQICLECLCDLPHTGYHKQAGNPVEQLFTGKNKIEYATAYLRYEKGGKVQSLVHSLKYHENKELGYLLGRQIARELNADHSPICTADLIIPVPLHPRKKRKRGYNQSEWIASGIRSILEIPIDTQSLARVTPTSSQTHKTIYERWLNVYSIFNVVSSENLKNKHILLIDDVITTGATISACAQALSEIPGIRISVLALSVA
ncbi:ComF family protein [uncultured Parabacteroides sp.]|uniref:ComF family protein n=1 Tax=uncultured Parabacteroides sp. TaxID=512312 RepID=UPI002625B1CD|nr:ComF family protein [uncultured Parabacteroides sp.]